MVPSLRRLIRGAAPAVCSTPAPLLLPPPHTADGTDQLCKEAQANLPNNPDILAFKQCAATKPISTSCCAKLAPFAKYAPCLSNDMYATAVNNYLGGATTIDEARKACLS
ncbi:hypothetical protein CHLRE_07g324233v5 [Chlamydomonas reinhardtii]|uniref:Uncharacterized protein n=1 Tax=Chlamydomonas reinhardtii TaxID=3055 RepID=A0A2K3DJA2_CHLRE|nr:uncharacterized protein CHLRE_07g324233v5 [Chlamydomonas reinhardtii]PNW80601.1 hypothetical protein CHLRE_07g324233v5 [Chlamydomonas reinhardtii]